MYRLDTIYFKSLYSLYTSMDWNIHVFYMDIMDYTAPIYPYRHVLNSVLQVYLGCLVYTVLYYFVYTGVYAACTKKHMQFLYYIKL